MNRQTDRQTDRQTGHPLDVVRDDKRRKLDRPLTGVIWKDRIWEQWYSEKSMNQKFPQMNQKDFLYQCIGDEPDRVLIDNRGQKKYTVREFQQMIDRYTRAFMALKLAVGDVVCTVSLTTPEMYAIKYSATSLGLITCHLNVFDVGIEDNGVNRLYRQLENVKPKVIFVLDYLEDKVAAVINNSTFSSALKIILPLDESVPGMAKEKFGLTLLGIRNRMTGKSVKNAIPLKKFLSGGKQITGPVDNVYEPGMPCNIAFTSGTTGINKAILLSHDANNALAFQQIIGDFGFVHDEKQLALVPPFLAFWDADIVHAVFCNGGHNAIELELAYDKIPEYLVKHHPQIGIWSQYLWDSMLTLPEQELKEVAENIREVIVGGERCEINQIESFYKKTGIIQMTGYGASEVNTTFTISHQYCNKIGTSGIPMPFNNVKILDENGKDVTYGQPGRLYITGPSLMNGYYGRPDLTEKVLTKDEEGTVWYNTGDYAVVDTDGCLTVLDRDQEPVSVTYEGKTEKVKLLDVNELILKNRNVKSSKLNAVDGKIFMYLVIDKYAGLSIEQALADIKNTIMASVPENCWPNAVVILDQLPRTQVGKVAYNLLTEESKKLSKKVNQNEKLRLLSDITF